VLWSTVLKWLGKLSDRPFRKMASSILSVFQNAFIYKCFASELINIFDFVALMYKKSLNNILLTSLLLVRPFEVVK
jgi:hypothetical protein